MQGAHSVTSGGGLEEDFAFAAGNVWDHITNKMHVSTLCWRAGEDFDELLEDGWGENSSAGAVGPGAAGQLVVGHRAAGAQPTG